MLCLRNPQSLTRVRYLSLIANLVILTSCGGGGPSGTPPPTLASLAVSSEIVNVAAGLPDQFTATGNFSDGSSKVLTTAEWSTSDATLAVVSPTGLVTTLKPGAVTISASSGSVSGNAPLTVGPPVPTGLVVSPSTSTLKLGTNTSTTLTATLNFSDNTTQDVSDNAI
jgi:hypothetical protein